MVGPLASHAQNPADDFAILVVTGPVSVLFAA